MPQRTQSSERGNGAERLLEAALPLLAEYGERGLTARRLADAADMPASAINYHFGGKTELLLACMEKERVAEQAWLDGLLAELDAVSVQIDQFSDWLSLVVLHRSLHRTRSTILASELSLKAGRDPVFRPVATAWVDMVDQFIGAGLSRFNGPATGRSMLVDLYCGLPILQARGDDGVLASALIRDVVTHVVDRLTHRPLTSTSWLGPARLSAARNVIDDHRAKIGRPAGAQRVLDGAVRLLMREGASALTHRAVSREAGVSLSATTRYFESQSDILQASFEALYAEMTREFVDPAWWDEEKLDLDDFLDRLDIHARMDEAMLDRNWYAVEELIQAARRDERMAPLAKHLTSSRGTTSSRVLSVINLPRPAMPLDGFVLSIAAIGGSYRLRLLPTRERTECLQDMRRRHFDTLYRPDRLSNSCAGWAVSPDGGT